MAKKIAVPSLVGTTENEAETTLTDAGLSVIKRYVSGEPDGTVYSQSPGKVAKGDAVTIDILRAPAAPLPVDLSAVTKSIGELKKTVAELEASLARADDIRCRDQDLRCPERRLHCRDQDLRCPERRLHCRDQDLRCPERRLHCRDQEDGCRSPR